VESKDWALDSISLIFQMEKAPDLVLMAAAVVIMALPLNQYFSSGLFRVLALARVMAVEHLLLDRPWV